MRQPAVIYDRDGTLASVAYCAPTDRDSEQWRVYNGLMIFDAVVPEVRQMVFDTPPGVARIMFSGRMAGDRPGDWHRYYQMWAWLNKHDIPIDFLFMRPGGDMRKDSDVKNEMLDAILPYFDVKAAVDDRPEVCDNVWRARGIPLTQVKDPGILPPILGGGPLNP